MDDFDFRLREAENTKISFSGSYDISDTVCDYPFNNLVFKNLTIKNGSLSGSVFTNCVFDGVEFQNLDLSMVYFVNCKMISFDITF